MTAHEAGDLTAVDKYGPAAQVDEVLRLHSRREFSGDGYGWANCAECRQSYPCATVTAILEATCPICDGNGYEDVPEAQCGDYEHEHGDGCVVPVEVPCRCVKPAALVHPGEEPF